MAVTIRAYAQVTLLELKQQDTVPPVELVFCLTCMYKLLVHADFPECTGLCTNIGG